MRRQGKMDRGLLIVALGLFSHSFGQVASAEHFEHCGLHDVRYEVIFLGSLGSGGGGGDAINDRGEIAGTTSLSDAVGRAFIWDCERGMQNIGALSEDHYASFAYDINNRGEVVGQSANDEVSIAFIWDRTNGMRAITDGNSLAYDINDRSEVILFGGVGVSYWSAANGLRAVTDVLGFDFTGDPYINNLGTIGGMRPIYDGDGPRFFNWNARTGLRDLGLRPLDHQATFISGMNDRGDLIGATSPSNGYVPFIVTRDGELQLLSQPQLGGGSTATSINNRRQVVGSLEGDAGGQPYLWDPVNGVRHVSELRANDAVHISSVNGINNWGWMAGSAIRDGAAEAALIVPVPKNSRYFRNLSQLSGPRLCRALDALKANAVVSCLLQRR